MHGRKQQVQLEMLYQNKKASPSFDRSLLPHGDNDLPLFKRNPLRSITILACSLSTLRDNQDSHAWTGGW